LKDFFDIMLILIITLTMFISMMFFASELTIQQEAIHLRSRVIEIIEIENGYTESAKTRVNKLIKNSKHNIIVNTSKNGSLEFGEKIIIEIIIFYERKLPFNAISKIVKYTIMGEYYNING